MSRQSYNLGDNDAKYPDAENNDEHTKEVAGFTTVHSGARSKCELVAGLSLAKEKACFKVHSQL